MAEGPPPFDWNKLFSKANQPRLIVGAVIVVVLIVAAAKLHIFPDSFTPMNRQASATTGGGSSKGGLFGGLLGGGHAGQPVALSSLTGGQCSTYAPDGWRVTDSNANGTAFTAVSGDGALSASYAGAAINSAAAQGVYGQQFTSPEAMLAFSASALAGEQIQVATNGQFGAYQVATLQGAGHGGYALYYRFQIPADPGGYGVIMRIALAAGGDPHAVGIAGAVAAATRCQAIVIPQPIGNDTDRGSSHGAGTSAKCREGACDDSDLAGTYNAQLGTGWAHDSLGRNYNVDVTTDYDDNGPDGPGYYGMVGGTRERLQPGLQ